MSASFFNMVERLLSATANGVYQGILVTALAGLALRFLVRTNAATRHAVWCAVLLLVTALIPAHLLLSFRPQKQASAAQFPPKPGMTASFNDEADHATAAQTATASSPSGETFSQEGSAPPSALGKQQRDQLSGAEAMTENSAATVAPDEAQTVSPEAFLNPFGWQLRKDITLPHSLCLGLISAWILLAGARGFLLARQMIEVRRVKRNSTAPGPALQMVFEKLRASLATRRHVQAKISNAHPTAGLLGFFHPVILLPADMDNDLDPSEAEYVLRHELAHVGRRDDWGNLAQQFVQAALFFHPAIWWISGRLSVEREIACDDHVLEASGRPRAYALTLANVASRLNQSGHLLAPGIFSSNSQLKQRITMILNTQRNRSPRLARRWLGFFTTATALLALLAVTAGPRLVLAQPAPEAPTSPAADGTPAALPPDAAETASGPRSKVSASADGAGASVAVVTPDGVPVAPPAPPAPVAVAPVPVAPMAPMVVMDAPAARPFGPDTTPSASPAPSAKQMSVEERLDRIERILEDLQGRGGKGRHRVDVKPDVGIVSVDSFDAQSINRATQEAKRAAGEVRRAVEAGERAAEAGQRAAEAGQRAAEQAMRNVERLKDKNIERMHEDWHGADSDSSQAELQALRGARDSLQNQIRNLERQIQQIEKGRKHDHPDQNDNRSQNDGSKDEKPEPKAS